MASTTVKSVKGLLVTVFALFLLFNVAIVTLSLIAAFKNGTLFIIPLDSGLGPRVLIVLIGLGASWAIGRYVFMRMVQAEADVSEAASASIVLLLYLAVLFVGIAFQSASIWLLQSVLLGALLLLTFLVLGRVIGVVISLVVVLVCLGLGAALFALWS